MKYSPLGNNGLEAFLAGEGCEVNLPGLLGFVQYCVSNMGDTVRFYGGSGAFVGGAEALLKHMDGIEQASISARCALPGYHAPARFWTCGTWRTASSAGATRWARAGC